MGRMACPGRLGGAVLRFSGVNWGNSASTQSALFESAFSNSGNEIDAAELSALAGNR